MSTVRYQYNDGVVGQVTSPGVPPCWNYTYDTVLPPDSWLRDLSSHDYDAHPVVWGGTPSPASAPSAPPHVFQYNPDLPKTPEPFTHDADGNLTQDGRWQYEWDAENRLTRMTAVANVPAAAKRKLEFAYDCYGRRISKKVYVWDAGTSSYSLNSERHFVYDGWNLIAELTAQNTPVRTYMWGLDTSGSMQGAGGIGGLLAVSNASDSTTHFVAMDGSGNCMALVNADTGAVSAEMEYGPFGEPIRRTGPMAKFFPFGFSTKYTDQESGLLSYGGNTMDPRTGRWLSRDSMEESGSIGLYVFVFNNPLSFVDLLGRQPISPNNNPVPVGTFTGPNPPPLNPGQTASPAVTINGKVTVWNIFETPFVWLEKDGRLADCMVLIVVGHNTYVEPFLKGYKPSEYTKLGMLGCWSGIKAVPEEGHAIGFDFPKPTGVIGWPQPPIEEYQKPLNAGFESFEKMMEAAFTSAKKEGQKLVQDADCKCKKSTVAVKCQAPQPNDKYTEWLNQKSWCNQVIATYERK